MAHFQHFGRLHVALSYMNWHSTGTNSGMSDSTPGTFDQVFHPSTPEIIGGNAQDLWFYQMMELPHLQSSVPFRLSYFILYLLVVGFSFLGIYVAHHLL